MMYCFCYSFKPKVGWDHFHVFVLVIYQATASNTFSLNSNATQEVNWLRDRHHCLVLCNHFMLSCIYRSILDGNQMQGVLIALVFACLTQISKLSKHINHNYLIYMTRFHYCDGLLKVIYISVSNYCSSLMSSLSYVNGHCLELH